VRSMLFILVAVVVIFIVIVSVYLTPDGLRDCHESPSGQPGCAKANAVVVISGGNTPARTNEAIRLYKAGWADTLIVSGAAADTTGPSNAEVMKDQAIKEGVPEAAILVESFAQTTKQNAERTKELLAEASDGDTKRVILVTSPYHQRRASLEFRVLAGDGIAIVSHPTPNDPDWSAFWWLTPRGWWLAMGELVKIGVFYLGESR
jgi:uncharacterized SAM-binding protein YcdF (DUF218 family)